MDKNRNVLHFADYRSPYPGNFITSLTSLARGAAERGRETVFLFPKETAERDWARRLGEEFPVYFLSGSFFKDLLTVRRLVRNHRVGIIHSHFYKLPYVFMFSFSGARQLIHLHCAVYRHAGLSGVIEKLLLGGRTFIGCSKKLADDVKARYPRCEAFVCENAVSLSRLESHGPLTREDLDVPPGAKAILLFGFLYEVKGVDLALKAAEELNAEGVAAHLLLVLSSNVAEITGKITETYGGIPPWLHILPPREDVAAYYDVCDLFLGASRSEGLPYSVLEAALLKKPLVLSDIPAHESLGLDAAVTFESGSADSLKAALLRAFGSAPDPEAARAQASSVAERYGMDAWRDKILAIYDR